MRKVIIKQKVSFVYNRAEISEKVLKLTKIEHLFAKVASNCSDFGGAFLLEVHFTLTKNDLRDIEHHDKKLNKSIKLRLFEPK